MTLAMLNHTIISDESFLSDQAIQHGMGQVFTSLARNTQWKVFFFINDKILLRALIIT